MCLFLLVLCGLLWGVILWSLPAPQSGKPYRFRKTPDIGAIVNIGDTGATVMKKLGHPDKINTDSAHEWTLWRYGAWYLQHGRVWGISPG